MSKKDLEITKNTKAVEYFSKCCDLFAVLSIKMFKCDLKTMRRNKIFYLWGKYYE